MVEPARMSRPTGVRARVWSRSRDCWRAREVDNDVDMVSRPAISSSKVLRSVRSAFPRMEPSALWKNDSRGTSAIFRSSAWRRDRLTMSMSVVASSPTCLRARSASVTWRAREKRLCHGELTEAKPERSDMKQMPMTPTRSRHASVRR